MKFLFKNIFVFTPKKTVLHPALPGLRHHRDRDPVDGHQIHLVGSWGGNMGEPRPGTIRTVEYVFWGGVTENIE